MLANKNRFHGHNSLNYVYRHGKSSHARLFKIKYVLNLRRNDPRFAIVISKKVHKSAVGRNLIRRRFYEAIRGEIPKLHSNLDLVVNITSGEALSASYSEISANLKQIFTESNLYK